MKTIKILLILLLLSGCALDTQPIEKYKNKGIVVIENHNPTFNSDASIRVKTKDSIFKIYLTYYDRKDLKVGDTIK